MRKVRKLSGSELDCWVARARGFEELEVGSAKYWLLSDGKSRIAQFRYRPSREWGQGGPIIEREKIRLWCDGNVWFGCPICALDEGYAMLGETPLIAAMRAYVASIYGEEVS